jgi:hypothetical protein
MVVYLLAKLDLSICALVLQKKSFETVNLNEFHNLYLQLLHGDSLLIMTLHMNSIDVFYMKMYTNLLNSQFLTCTNRSAFQNQHTVTSRLLSHYYLMNSVVIPKLIENSVVKAHFHQFLKIPLEFQTMLHCL